LSEAGVEMRLLLLAALVAQAQARVKPCLDQGEAEGNIPIGGSSFALTGGDLGAQFVENIDAAGQTFFFRSTNGDLMSAEIVDGGADQLNTLQPSTGQAVVLPFSEIKSNLSLSTVATAGAMRVKRGDNCTLFVSYNAPPASADSNPPIGKEGYLAVIDLCSTIGTGWKYGGSQTGKVLHYVDLTPFAYNASGSYLGPTVVADAVAWNSAANGSKIFACLLVVGKIIMMDDDLTNPTELLTDELAALDCTPNGVEATLDYKYLLISCFRFPGAPVPKSGLLRYNVETSELTPTLFFLDSTDLCGPQQVDDIRFNPAGDKLILSVGDYYGTPYSNSAVEISALWFDPSYDADADVSQSEFFARVQLEVKMPMDCTPMAATTYIGDALFGICAGMAEQTPQKYIYQFTNRPPTSPPPPSPPNPPSPPPSVPPSPSPPPGAPSCLSSCTVYRNGAVPGSKAADLCMKEEGDNIVCTPNFANFCDGGMLPCRTGDQPYTPTQVGTCVDAGGKWERKCKKKANKTPTKCYKKKIQRKCKYTCSEYVKNNPGVTIPISGC